MQDAIVSDFEAWLFWRAIFSNVELESKKENRRGPTLLQEHGPKIQHQQASSSHKLTCTESDVLMNQPLEQ